MKRTLIPTALALGLVALAGAAQAACYVDYKARRDNPLKLHYGVMQVNTCTVGAARAEVQSRLAANGWTLLNVMSVFEQSGLDQRKANAGQYYLRF